MRKTIFALAAGLIAVSASAASAMPGATAGQLNIETAGVTEQVVHRGGNNSNRMHNRHNRNRMNHRDNDHRYDQYRGWNRFNSRPRGWRNRGCVAVGPIWFCK